jgi:hypothetical protein
MERIVPKPIMESKYREEIDHMLENGDTYSAISNWLSNHGETISRQVISKYHKFGYNINMATAEVYASKSALEEDERSKERLNKAANEQSATLQLYDKFISIGNDVVASNLDDRTKADIAIKAAKQREDFMREHGDSAMEEMAATIEELRAEIKEMNLLEVIRGMSDDRTRKRIKETDNS